MSIRPYHFIRFEPNGFTGFRRRVEHAGGTVCLDLEDSVDSPDAAERRALKRRRRHDLVDLLRASGPDAAGLFVRINAAGTADHARDVAALASLSDRPGLFLPKAERPGDVAALLAALAVPALVPVVESEAGFAGLAGFRAAGVRAAGGSAVAEVAFGHCDYNLDRGLFPFAHHDDARYWAWMDRLDAGARASGLGVVHSPVLRLDDLGLFQAVQTRLGRYPSATGQVTLSLAQTQACAAPGPAGARPDPGPAPPGADAAHEAALEVARQTVQHFRAHRRPDGHFALDGARTVVSPQEYRAACAVLAAHAQCA